jgi:hypothetical protein
MTRGLLAPLSPHEEIALRRVAYGSPVIDVHVAGVLCRLGLIERTATGFRLTPLGQQRYDALPTRQARPGHSGIPTAQPWSSTTGPLRLLLQLRQFKH